MIAGKLEIDVTAKINKVQLTKEIEKAAKLFEKKLGSISVTPGVKAGKGKSKKDKVEKSEDYLSGILKVLMNIHKLIGQVPTSISKPEIVKTKTPFDYYNTQKTQVGKIGLDSPEKSIVPEKESVNIKKAMNSALKLFKLDLIWRWIKGSFNALISSVPLLGKLYSVISKMLELILTALILPFLPEILTVLKFLVAVSVGFFKYMQSLKNLSPSEIAKTIVADINTFFKEFPWKDMGVLVGKAIQDTVDFVDKFLKGIKWETIGESFGKFFNGIVEGLNGTKIGQTIADGINGAIKFLTGMFSSVDWVAFGTDIGGAFATAIIKIDWSNIGTLIYEGIKAAFGALWGVGIGIGQSMRGEVTNKNLLSTSIGTNGLINTVLKSLGPLGPILAKAEGGPVSSGRSYITGENGPEIFNPGSSGNIIPNDKIGGSSTSIGNISVSITTQKIDSTNLDYIAKQVGDKIYSDIRRRSTY